MLEPSTPSRISDVILCDDQYITLVGIEALLKILLPKATIRIATRGEEALFLFQAWPADLMIVDLGLADISGLEVVGSARKLDSNCKILVITGSDDPHVLQQAIRSGANGVIRKLDTPQNLGEALHHIARQPLDVYMDDSVRSLVGSRRDQPLSKREYEVLNLIVKGQTSQEIADNLACSITTVKTYRARIMNKSGTRNSAEMIAWFLKGNPA